MVDYFSTKSQKIQASILSGLPDVSVLCGFDSIRRNPSSCENECATFRDPDFVEQRHPLARRPAPDKYTSLRGSPTLGPFAKPYLDFAIVHLLEGFERCKFSWRSYGVYWTLR